MAAIPGRPDPWKTLGKLVAALVAAGILVAGLALPYVGGIGLVAGSQAGKFDNTVCDLQESKPPQKTTLLARDGKTTLATLFSQDRVEVGLDQIPKSLQYALVATEDRRFYTHHGVDMRGLLRSAVNTTNGDTQGGSTLTMQYVKQIRFYEAGDDLKKQRAAIDQTLQRKMEDARCAIYIENTLHESKQKILQNYLNIAFFGENSYGISTAARTYFNKSTSQLTLGESALLVGLLRAPSAYDPFTDKLAAKTRRDEVINNLVAVHKLPAAQGAQEKAKPIALATNAPPKIKEGCANSDSSVPNIGFFCDYVRNWLIDNNGLTDSQLQTGGLKIVTTLDPAVQTSAQTQLRKSVPATSPYTAVLPAVDPRTGDILAMAASKDYGLKTNQTEQPLFTKRVASGASTYKLFPLLSALGVGMDPNWTLATVGGNTAKYLPKKCATKKPGASNGDANESYNVNESLKSATAKSSNTFFLGLADQFFNCDLSPIVQTAKALGISSFDLPSDVAKQTIGQTIIGQQRAQALVLGSVGTSPLELTGAYAGVANEGNYNTPAPVISVTDSGGNALPVKRSPGKQVVAAQAAVRAVSLLTGDTHGNGTSAGVFGGFYSAGGSSVAGKTGTAPAVPESKNGAIWFTGMTPKLVATSALIDFDNPNLPSTGLPGVKKGEAYGDYAAKVWLAALEPTLKKDKWAWPSDSDVAGVDVPDVTNKSLAEAKSALTEKGFKMVQLGADANVACPSSVPLEQVGYYGPKKAPVGSTITVCLSSGSPQPYSSPPVYIPFPRSGGTTNRGGSHGHGSGSGSSSSPGNGSGGGPGGGSGGGPSGGGHGGGPGGGRGGVRTHPPTH
ncbi:MAG: transglycosylase domain-containing protein [Jatrophihabitans sp.]